MTSIKGESRRSSTAANSRLTNRRVYRSTLDLRNPSWKMKYDGRKVVDGDATGKLFEKERPLDHFASTEREGREGNPPGTRRGAR